MVALNDSRVWTDSIVPWISLRIWCNGTGDCFRFSVMTGGRDRRIKRAETTVVSRRLAWKQKAVDTVTCACYYYVSTWEIILLRRSSFDRSAVLGEIARKPAPYAKFSQIRQLLAVDAGRYDVRVVDDPNG